MARKPRAKAAEAKASNQFLDALKFVGTILSDKGSVNETHVFMNNKWAVAFNGTMATGYKIEEDIYAYPQYKLLIEALSKCGDYMSITQLESDRLSIKSGKFKAIVPGVHPLLFECKAPDAPVAPIDDRLKLAFETIGVIQNENTNRVIDNSILMNGSTLVASNGIIILEYWHGLNLPIGLSIPKAFVTPLSKTSKKLAKFGFSRSSITLYYEDDSWIKTQLWAGTWPDVRAVLDRPNNPYPIPGGFFEGLGAIAPFADSGLVYFGQECLHSHVSGDQGASYDVPGLPKGPAYSVKNLALIKPHCHTVDFLTPGQYPNTYMLYFYGPNVRGAIAGVKQVEPSKSDLDKDIPF